MSAPTRTRPAEITPGPPNSPRAPNTSGPAPGEPPTPGRRGLLTARAALIVGVLYAAVSLYWALGGTWLLDTVAASLTRHGGAAKGFIVAAWVAAGLKIIAAAMPLVALHRLTGAKWDRRVWVLAWAGAVILIIYGLVQTTAGLLVVSDVLHASADADHRALAWRAYLWDPWFLIWGVLAAVALRRGRDRRTT